MGFGLKRDLARYFIGTALCRLVCSCFAIPYLKNQEVFIGIEPQRWMAGSLQQEGFRAQLLCKAWRSKIFEVFQLFPFRFDSARCSCYFRVAIYGTGAEFIACTCCMQSRESCRTRFM